MDGYQLNEIVKIITRFGEAILIVLLLILGVLLFPYISWWSILVIIILGIIIYFISV